MSPSIENIINRITDLAFQTHMCGCLYTVLPDDNEHDFDLGDPKTIQCCIDYVLTDYDVIDDVETLSHIFSQVEEHIGVNIYDPLTE
jgi:hypothetical protein